MSESHPKYAASSPSPSRPPQPTRRYVRKRSHNGSGVSARRDDAGIAGTRLFLVLVVLLAFTLTVQFAIVFGWHHSQHDQDVLGSLHKTVIIEGDVDRGDVGSDGDRGQAVAAVRRDNGDKNGSGGDDGPPHLVPKLPPMPAFHVLDDSPRLIADVLSGNKPTIAGIAALLSEFIREMHESNKALAARKQPHRVQRDDVHEAFVTLATRHLAPLDDAYRGRSIFPVREDDSVFLSLASFRDHLLGDTLKGAFDNAAHPEKLFIGAVVQNCFGVDGVVCKTGAQVVGKNANGHDMTKVSDAPPDRNGVDEFCSDETYTKYCDAGQVRALYVHEYDSLGPAMARYYASKLWGGETYFVQVDSHLQFAKDWDRRYIEDLQLAKSYPKALLSAYPPGFNDANGGHLNAERETPGSRLCMCEFSTSDVEQEIIRINTGAGYHGRPEHPTQVAFVAAGFFFVRSEFLLDVPFDPYMPWCFMGEEIMLSMRAWTSGWDIYAPRTNLIAHQYRPGRMGLPKFWGSVGRLFGRPGPNFSNMLQIKMIKRVKYMVGYRECTREKIKEEGHENVLMDVEHYGFGNVRTPEDYLELTKIDVQNKRCHKIEWCNNGDLS